MKLGALALGAASAGASAYGAVAVARLAIRRAAIKRLEIAEFEVCRLNAGTLELRDGAADVPRDRYHSASRSHEHLVAGASASYGPRRRRPS